MEPVAHHWPHFVYLHLFLNNHKNCGLYSAKTPTTVTEPSVTEIDDANKLQCKPWFFKSIISLFQLFCFVMNLTWITSLSSNLYLEWTLGKRIRQSVYVFGTHGYNPLTVRNSTAPSSLSLLAELQSWVWKGSKSPILKEGLF
jgi:hypothetical protein